MSTPQQISSPPAALAEVQLNENMAALGQAFVWAHDVTADTGLTVGLAGGNFDETTVADDTLACTDDDTNYIVVNRSTLVASVATTTTNWDDVETYGRIASVVFTDGVLMTWADERYSPGGIFDSASAIIGSVTAADVSIADAGTYFTGTDVEAALQEIGAALGSFGTGDVTGPGSAVDGHLVQFDGTTGKLIKDGIGLGANVAAFLSTPSSSNLAAALTDETGTGALVFANSPTLVTPALGTPASGNLANCTGLPVAGGGTGAATLTNHGVLLGQGASAVSAVGAMSDGQIIVGQTGADPLGKTMSGDATLAASGALTIANDVVSYAKMQNVSAASKLLGRGDSGSGDPQEITLGTGLTMSGTTLNSSGGGIAPDVQTFTADGTWTKPSGCTLVRVVCIGGGGGGGGGCGGSAGTLRHAGGAGGGGALAERVFVASELAGTVAVTVGSAGGAGTAGSAGSGGQGGVGGTSSFGAHLSAYGGGGGGAGTAASGNTGGSGGGTGGVGANGVTSNISGGLPSSSTSAPGIGGGGACAQFGSAGFHAEYGGASGGSPPGSAGVSNVGGSSLYGGGGGGSGGSVTSGNSARSGQAGGVSGSCVAAGGGSGGSTAGAAGTAGTNGTSIKCGFGGGGGAGNDAGTGGAGGAGGTAGGGGGGGGGGTTTGGLGGAGGRGEVRVYSW